MPQTITIGQEFMATQVANGDGSQVQIWVRVTAGSSANPGKFEARCVNTAPAGAAPGLLVILQADNVSILDTFDLPPGDTNLLNLPGGKNANFTWTQARDRFYVQGNTR